MDKKKVLSSLALAGILTASVLGANVNAATEGEYLKPVGVYKKLIDGEMVVPYLLKERRKPLTVKDIQSEFKNLTLINGNAVTDTNATVTTGDTFTANEIKHTVVVYGDVNKDGIITTADASFIQRIRANKEKDLEPAQLIAANVLSSDGKITTADASRVQRYVANKADSAVIIDPIPAKEDVTAPVISGVTNGERKIINLNDNTFVLPNVTAIDDYDGKVEVTIEGDVDITEVGEYPITYKAIDREGNEATVTYTVVVDNQAPVINGLPEENKIYIKQNGEFTLPIVKATDNVDGVVEVKLVITNSDDERIEEIDTDEEGEYTLTYTAEDSLGNKKTAIVTVMVDGTNPVIEKVEYTPEGAVQTNGNVVVKITVNEPIQKIDGWELSDDRKTMTKEYAQNVTAEEVKIQDLAGNESTTTVTILNIDKEAPEVNGVEEKSYKEVTPSFNVAEVSVATLQKEGEAPKAYTSGTKIGKNDKSEDGNYTLVVKDVAGNVTTKKFTIDNEAPILVNETPKTLFKNGDTIAVKVTGSDNVDEEIIPELTITTSTGEEVDGIEAIDTTKDGVYTFTYEAKDSAGNIATPVVVNVTVDATPAKLLSLIPSTNKITTEVTITAEFDEPMQELTEESGWIATSNKTFTKKYTSNTLGKELVEFKDLAGNVTTINFTIDNIDELELVGVASYAPSDKKAQSVVVTIRAEKELKPLAGWNLEPDGKSITKTYYANVEEKVTIEDLAGHRNEVDVIINNIDTIAPTATVSYSNEDPNNQGQTLPTNQNVVVTITASEEVEPLDGWTWILTGDNETIMTKSYEANTTIPETIKVTDLAGNESSELTINVTNIDKEAPTVTGFTEGKNSYQNLVLTFADINGVTASIQKDNGVETPIEPATGITLGNSIAEEGTYVLKVKDDLGNEETYSFIIDQTPVLVEGPVNGGKYNKITPVFTEGVGSLEKLDAPTKVEQWKSGGEITEVGRYKLTVKDAAGNQTVITFEIDKTLPEFTNIDENEVFNANQVPLTPTIDKTVASVVLKKDGKVDETYSQLAPISDEGKYQLTVTDEAGNEATVNFSIDKKVEFLSCTTSNDNQPTNQSVVVTIIAAEELQDLSGWSLSSDKKTMTKTYGANTTETITIKDKAGNEKNVDIEVAGIDKTALQANVSYSNEDPDNAGQTLPAKKVIVTITATPIGKQLKEKAGWELADDKSYMTKEYTADTTEPQNVQIEDLAGNKTTVAIEVTNVYHKAPTITINGNLSTAVTEVSTTEGNIVLPTVTATDIKGNAIPQVTTEIKKIEGENTIVVVNPNVTELDVSNVCKYEITYTARDVAGNETIETRTIIVK